MAVISIPLCVMGYLSFSYPQANNDSSSDYPAPLAKLTNNSYEVPSDPDFLNPREVREIISARYCVESLLNSKTGQIAASTGFSEDEVKNAISDMRIDSWEATTLPTEATEHQSSVIEIDGSNTVVTSYVCNGQAFVSVYNTQDGCVTLSIPESASEPIEKLSLNA